MEDGSDASSSPSTFDARAAPSLQLLLVLGGPLHGVLDLLQAALDDEVAGRGALLHQPDELEREEELCEALNN
ncbi:hypothetical protein AVEN_219565-1 [Araneus ventricosus]|uniref:Uncharacterized protein n=1 Tax=Araneus ventricosus TaxID=182803 RepID=A0A4Y2X8K5_ARAVE|nr:hypothetical protein AVEN_219565-1 [Araneus ventricosus]